MAWWSIRPTSVFCGPRIRPWLARVLFYDVVNRGKKIALTTYFDEASRNITNSEDAESAFFMRQGYTVVWSGWQCDIPMSGDGTRIGAEFPVATNADGTPITGPSREEIVFDNATTTTMPLTWPTAARDSSNGSLRVKEHQTDPWTDLPGSAWSWMDDNSIHIDRPASFDAGAIYEFTYTARDPKVMGIGFAAVRDLVTFLKQATTDNRGNANPLNDLRQAPGELADPSAQCATNPADDRGCLSHRGHLAVRTVHTRFHLARLCPARPMVKAARGSLPDR
jgi:hypothetical protein